MTDIFLSYARGDDEPYTRQLYDQLRDEGYDVWFDRERMPSRALTFLQEIRDAIRASRRLLVVLGPRAAESDYVRAEWQSALVDGKVVTPLLRLGSYEIVPPELANLHCPDVRETRAGAAAFAEIVRILRDPVPALGALRGAVPEMPAHFQPRPNTLSTLAGALLYDVEHPVVVDGPLRTTVLHGMGGVGKSVVAAACARSTTTRRVFRDGIVWASATPAAQPLDIVRAVLASLGAPAHASAGLSEAITALRVWLDERRCLVVLDNVWHVEQATPISSALSPVSRLLLTTRDASLATALGANACPLDVLEPEEALRHLADWVGVDQRQLPPEALDVAAETGYLPLAVSLQGALARDGVAWGDLLHALRHAELDFADRALPNYPYRNVLAALLVGVDMLRAEDASAAERFLDLAGFFWEGSVPERAVTRLWAWGPNGLAEHRARNLVVTLERKALLRLEGTSPLRRVRLHDLMIDFLSARGNVAASRAKVVDAYRAACRNDWYDGPDDGYFLEHLLDHLACLPDGRAELDRLLKLEDGAKNHAWFEVVDTAGKVEHYRQQLTRLLVAEETRESEAQRLALLLGSVVARTAHMPAALLGPLIDKGVWSTARALDHARQQPLAIEQTGTSDTGVRMRALLVVAERLAHTERADVVEEAFSASRDTDGSTSGLDALAKSLAKEGRVLEALAIARRADHGDSRTAALAGVAPLVPPEERTAILAEASEDCATTGDLFRSAALTPLMPLLDAAAVAALRQAAVAPLTNPMARGWCEALLVTRLSELGLLPDALSIARAIQDPVSCAGALASLLPALGDESRQEALDSVLHTVVAIDEKQWRSDVEASFQDLPDMLLRVVPIIFAPQSWRPEVLKTVMPFVQGSRLATALEVVRDSNDRRFAAEATAAIAPNLAAQTRADLVQRAVDGLRFVDDTVEKARGLVALFPELAREQRDAQCAQMLAAISTAEDSVKVEALKVLGPALTSAHVAHALELAQQIKEANARSGVVEAMIPALGPSELPRARRVLGVIDDGVEVLLASAALAAHAPHRHREILHMAAQADEYERARALALIVPYLDAAGFETAYDLLNTIGDPGSLAEVALPAFARRAPDPRRTEILRRAIRVSATISDTERLSWAFAALLKQLTPELLDEALTAYGGAEASFGEEWRTYGRALYLAVALPGLRDPRRDAVWGEVAELTSKLSDAGLTRDLLWRLCEHARGNQYEQVIAMLAAEPDACERGITAGFLIGNLPATLRPRVIELAFMAPDDADGTEYQDAKERLEGAWARLLAYTHNPAVALRIAAEFKSASWKRAALLEFARTVSAERFDDVLSVARSLTDSQDRTRVLVALAGAAPPERKAALLAEAFTAALAYWSETLHDDVLPELARALLELPRETVGVMWRNHRLPLSELARPQLLRKLHWLAPALLHADAEAATAALDAVLDVQRWWP